MQHTEQTLSKMVIIRWQHARLTIVHLQCLTVGEARLATRRYAADANCLEESLYVRKVRTRQAGLCRQALVNLRFAMQVRSQIQLLRSPQQQRRLDLSKNHLGLSCVSHLPTPGRNSAAPPLHLHKHTSMWIIWRHVIRRLW